MDAAQSLPALTLLRLRTVGGLTCLLMALALPLLPARQGPYTFSLCAAGRHSGHPAVVCGEGLLALHEVIPAGRHAMSGEDFARGQRDLTSVVLGQ